jgi:tetratricopeptide (TPR) repeat protein
MALINTVPPWERYWVEGSVRTLTGDHQAAVPLYQALLRLRPDHHYGANNLLNELLALGRDDDALRARVLIANQRPNDINASYGVALELLAHHDVNGAQPFVDRLNRLLQGEPATPMRDNIAVWLKMIPLYIEWDAGRVSEVRRDLVAIEKERSTKSPQYRDTSAAAVGWVYLALGRFHDAAAFFNAYSISRYRHQFLFDLADLADNTSAMRTELGQFDSTDQAMKYLRAGLIGEVRRAVAAPHRSFSAGNDFAALAKGELAVLDNRPADGIAAMRTALSVARRWRNSFPDYLMGCESFGNALSQAGDDKGAMQALEACTDERPGYSMTFMAPYWLRAKVHLADLYRKAGRIDDAQRHEQEVRALLSTADPDHPLLRHLEAVATH